MCHFSPPGTDLENEHLALTPPQSPLGKKDNGKPETEPGNHPKPAATEKYMKTVSTLIDVSFFYN